MVLKYPFKFKFDDTARNFFRSNNIWLDFMDKIDGVYQDDQLLTLKQKVIVEPFCTLCKGSFYSSGSFSFSRSRLSPSAVVGRYCSIGSGVKLMGAEHPIDRISTHIFTYRENYLDIVGKNLGAMPKAHHFEAGVTVPVVIGNDVWIGDDVTLKRGIKIGDGAVIGARALVTRDVEPFEVVAGIPAKVIKMRFGEDEGLRRRILDVAWWRYSPDAFHDLDTTDPGAFIDALGRKIGDAEVSAFTPPRIDIAEGLAAARERKEQPVRAASAVPQKPKKAPSWGWRLKKKAEAIP